MKTERNILFAFILNLSFSVFELLGGVFTGSVAILSDAMHDVGDATSIGISYFLEKKSKKQADDQYTYGYGRYSVIGGFITTLILMMGSAFMMYNGIRRIVSPTEVNYMGMIHFAIVGVGVNLCAALCTRGKGSHNQKAVNLHMLEDVLSWVVVLLGAIVMKFTDWCIIDPVMSIGISLYILIHSTAHLKETASLLADKVPPHISIAAIVKEITEIGGVERVCQLHAWSIDENEHCATLHLVTHKNAEEIKFLVRNKLHEQGIDHVTIEVEGITEPKEEYSCSN